MKDKNAAPQPPMANALTVGEMMIHYLRLEGVTHVFGIPGGGLMHFLVNLKNNVEDFHYVICRQETGAAYAADGYYRATGKLGVVAVTTGPGATNALTGVMNAQADGSAVLLITGQIDQKFDGMGYLQEGVDSPLDIDAVYDAAVGYSASLSSGSSSITIMKQALRDALSMPRQAVHLALPVNVTIQPAGNGAPMLPITPKAYRTDHKGTPIREVERAMKRFLECERPLLFIGNGCREALREHMVYDSLMRFVEHYAIPVMTTPDGKGLFPESHELSLRVYGMADCMWPYYYLTQQEPYYDGLMVIGSSLGELSTNKWSPYLIPKGTGAPFIQVDINQRIIARSFEVTQGIVGESGSFINDLASLMHDFPVEEDIIQRRRDFIANIKEHSPFVSPKDYNSNDDPMQPAAMMRALQNSIPEDTIIYIDAGNCVGWSVHYLCIDPPTRIFTSLAMGPMGFAVGAVVGGKVGCPESTCIAFTGDGAFMMQGSEISTAAQNKIGAIWLVLSDNNLNMVSQGMEHFFPDKKDPKIWNHLYELGNPDLVKYSEGLGADAYKISSPDDLEKLMPKVIKKANAGKPQVIIAEIDTKAEPPYYNPIYGPKRGKVN